MVVSRGLNVEWPRVRAFGIQGPLKRGGVVCAVDHTEPPGCCPCRHRPSPLPSPPGYPAARLTPSSLPPVQPTTLHQAAPTHPTHHHYPPSTTTTIHYYHHYYSQLVGRSSLVLPSRQQRSSLLLPPPLPRYPSSRLNDITQTVNTPFPVNSTPNRALTLAPPTTQVVQRSRRALRIPSSLLSHYTSPSLHLSLTSSTLARIRSQSSSANSSTRLPHLNRVAFPACVTLPRAIQHPNSNIATSNKHVPITPILGSSLS